MSDEPKPPIQVGLSTSSVYPQNTEAAFQYAAEAGYDGIELMIWAESLSQDLHRVETLTQRYDLPVLAVHAPCLLVSQYVWGRDPVAKLDRSVEAAVYLGADVVVIHPPFRWQRKYCDGFADQIRRLEEVHGVKVAVENMFPMRLDRFFGKYDAAADRMARRGGHPGAGFGAFYPSIDPTDVGYDHYTLDLSHCATAGTDALRLTRAMGANLAHVHLTDGNGAAVDEHLVPGRGRQPCGEVLRELVRTGFSGHVVVEIGTSSAKTHADRLDMVSESLEFARQHLQDSADLSSSETSAAGGG